MKTIVIDFLYLDLTTCERCMGTDKVLEEVIRELNPTLLNRNIRLILKKTKIDSPESAFQYHFLSSPTIRVDGFDILGEVRENLCESCGDICGTETLCRVFEYEGKSYNEPPRGMLKKEILKVVDGISVTKKSYDYKLPGNIANFLHRTH